MLFQYFSVNGYGHYLPGDELSALLEGFLGGKFQTAAARDLHPDDGNALDVITGDDGLQLHGIVHAIQLGAADEGDLVPDKILMEISVGVSGAIGSDEQIGTVKIGCIDGGQFDLYRPV